MHTARRFVIVLFALLFLALNYPAAAAEKVIIDSDMVMLFDDGVAMMMLANHPDINLLGVTIVPGNTWVSEGTAYAFRQLEILNRPDVPVAAGTRHPLRASRHQTIAT
jgi:inosine-uridine nucleoside N-ribohydrolase